MRELEESGAAVALLGEVTGGQLREAVGPSSTTWSAGPRWPQRSGRTVAAGRLVDVILSAAAQ
ncbi:hypothetical protein [Streptomyces sp. CB00316]|uniref:hypothetical protein n=1 Tax=Streptomyces sp. CB00316 TaxID=1703932 RepID=UPI001F1F100F|nr:hypothetical protein [Streptomyces sp. CB00316]